MRLIEDYTHAFRGPTPRNAVRRLRRGDGRRTVGDMRGTPIVPSSHDAPSASRGIDLIYISQFRCQHAVRENSPDPQIVRLTGHRDP